MNRRLAWLLAVVAQLALLGWIVAREERLRAHGRTVVLEVVPFDPVDPLSGRYLDIRLAAARIDLALVPGVAGMPDPERAAEYLALHHDVAVDLREQDGIWVPDAVRIATGRERGTGAPFLRGRVTSSYGSTIEVDYGLDRFFIPADASDPSFLPRPDGQKLRVVLKVDVEGRATIADLLVDGKPFSEWNAAQPR